MTMSYQSNDSDSPGTKRGVNVMPAVQLSEVSEPRSSLPLVYAGMLWPPVGLTQPVGRPSAAQFASRFGLRLI